VYIISKALEIIDTDDFWNHMPFSLHIT
jgi:hypothetical protein